MSKDKLPLVSEPNGFKLKKLGFNWKVNHSYSEFNGLTESITLSGINYNEPRYSHILNISECCSIPSVALVFQWMELEHGIYLGKDWILQEFSLIDYKTMEPMEEFAVVEINETHNTPNDTMEEILGVGLDYLIKLYFPVFGETVRLNNGLVGRCIGNYKGLFCVPNPTASKSLDVADIDIEYLRINGKGGFSPKLILPSDKEIDKLRTPEHKN